MPKNLLRKTFVLYHPVVKEAHGNNYKGGNYLRREVGVLFCEINLCAFQHS